MMKLRETEFFGQFVSVVAGSLLLVMTCAFVAIPATLSVPPGVIAAAPVPVHLT